MRVMLVRKFTQPSIGSGMCPPKMEVGDVFNVLDEYNFCGTLFYKLVEFGNGYGFDSRHFATLPDNTADEMAEESKEAIVNLETVLV